MGKNAYSRCKLADKGLYRHDIVNTSHPAVLDGFTNQARWYIERDREPENKSSESEKALVERLAEMSAVVKICGALSMKDVVCSYVKI